MFTTEWSYIKPKNLYYSLHLGRKIDKSHQTAANVLIILQLKILSLDSTKSPTYFVILLYLLLQAFTSKDLWGMEIILRWYHVCLVCKKAWVQYPLLKKEKYQSGIIHISYDYASPLILSIWKFSWFSFCIVLSCLTDLTQTPNETMQIATEDGEEVLN